MIESGMVPVIIPGDAIARRAIADLGFEQIPSGALARTLQPYIVQVPPKARVRLSAGREDMSVDLQALAFTAGASSIFYGEKLLTTGNPDVERDRALLARLKISAETQAQTDARGCS